MCVLSQENPLNIITRFTLCRNGRHTDSLLYFFFLCTQTTNTLRISAIKTKKKEENNGRNRPKQTENVSVDVK